MEKLELVFLLIFLIFINSVYAETRFILRDKTYLSNQIIVKFKENSDNPNLLTTKSGLSSIGLLNSKYEVISIESLKIRTNKDVSLNEKDYTRDNLDRIFLLKMKSNDIDSAVRDYSNNPNVEYAEPDYIVHVDTIPNDPELNKLYGLINNGQTGGKIDADIDASEAWDVEKGKHDVIVAVIDTGVAYNHSDLAQNIWINTNEIPSNGIDEDHD